MYTPEHKAYRINTKSHTQGNTEDSTITYNSIIYASTRLQNFKRIQNSLKLYNMEKIYKTIIVIKLLMIFRKVLLRDHMRTYL